MLLSYGRRLSTHVRDLQGSSVDNSKSSSIVVVVVVICYCGCGIHSESPVGSVD